MKKIPDNIPMPIQIKVTLLMNTLNELLEELNNKEIIKLEVDDDERTDDEKHE